MYADTASPLEVTCHSTDGPPHFVAPCVGEHQIDIEWNRPATYGSDASGHVVSTFPTVQNSYIA
jgi:hypothetical protein